MMFNHTPIEGAVLVKPEPSFDERGYFARIFCAAEFERRGLTSGFTQASISYTAAAGTLRGMHYQAHPNGESKLVCCVRGAIWDVIADLRPASSTYLQWWGTVVDGEDRSLVYVPEGVAHGFVSLDADTEVLYQISAPHVPQSARGFRWDDPAFGIEWPVEPRVISTRDRTYPDFPA